MNKEARNTTRESLLERIRALGFVKGELELFLDTHPDCPAALDYFTDARDELTRLTEEYEKAFGPLTYTGVTGDTWSWVDAEWPWHACNGALKQPRRRER